MTPGVTAGQRFRSWADIQANAARGAGGLEALGVGEDDSVALMLRNDFPTFEVNMAASQLGAYAVPINWHFTPEEANHILRDSGAKVLVAHTDLLAQIASGIPAAVKVLAVPTPQEIAAAYNVPAERRVAPAGVLRPAVAAVRRRPAVTVMVARPIGAVMPSAVPPTRANISSSGLWFLLHAAAALSGGFFQGLF